MRARRGPIRPPPPPAPSAASRAATLVTEPDAVYVQRVPALPSILVAPTAATPEFTPTCSAIGPTAWSVSRPICRARSRMRSAVSVAARA